ncbi:MAG: molecular chaperone Hsp90 [Thomasclavelia sp.]
MEKNLDYIISKTKELIEAVTCCKELKEAGKNYLDAIGSDQENEMAKAYFKEMEEDIMPIDNLIAFAGSEAGTQVFGDRAKEVEAHSKAIKEAGAKYCDCPACQICEELLAKKADYVE